MTHVDLPSIATQNRPLLEAIEAGPATGPAELATRAGIVPNNVQRKLDSLLADGLIRKTGEKSHEVEVTDDGKRALVAMAVFRGELQLGGAESAVREIPFGMIVSWPDQPRSAATIDDASIEEMAQSVADKGILQPLTVRPHGEQFQVIIGERRRLGTLRAVTRGWLPADFTIPCQVEDLADDEAFEAAVAENTQREDMHWMDDARAFLRMNQRGRSAAEVQRISGTKRGLRSVQDLILIARQLPPDMVARTYLPEKHPDYLSYVRAREEVGEKKARPALELTPKVRLALVETIYAGMEPGQDAPRTGTIITRFYKAPVGGPLANLQDRKLVVFGFQGREIVARTEISPDVAAFLEQIGFYESPETALFKVQAEVVGELEANRLGPADEFVTAELNEPEPVQAAGPAQPMLQDGPSNPGFEPSAAEDDDQSEMTDDEASAISREMRDDRERDLAEFSRPSATPAASPLLEPKPLPPMLKIVVLEAAHRIGQDGVERGPGTWASPVLASYYKDARGAQLVQEHKLLAFLPMGQKTLVTVTKRALDLIGLEGGFVNEETGQPSISDAHLRQAQSELMGGSPDGATYTTPWLNPPAEEAETPAAAPASPPPPPAASTLGANTFSDQMIQLSRESKAMAGLAAALRQADITIRTAASRKLKPEERDQACALIEAALGAAQPYLPEA